MLDLVPDLHDEGGPAAQTGSLTHAGVAEFHRARMGGDKLDLATERGWEAIRQASALFPLAEENEVRLFYTPYTKDPRNYDAEMLAVEQQIDFTLPPHDMDPTHGLIYVQGTFDQIRLHNGQPCIYDLKTGKKTGWEMVHDYAVQLAAYSVGVWQLSQPHPSHVEPLKVRGRKKVTGPILPTLPFDRIKPGYIIRAHGYRTRTVFNESPDGVFWPVGYEDIADAVVILENVRLHVALIRMGHVNFGPGPHCTYCEFGGLPTCMRRWKDLQNAV